jgi:hypothetical protein
MKTFGFINTEPRSTQRRALRRHEEVFLFRKFNFYSTKITFHELLQAIAFARPTADRGFGDSLSIIRGLKARKSLAQGIALWNGDACSLSPERAKSIGMSHFQGYVNTLYHSIGRCPMLYIRPFQGRNAADIPCFKINNNVCFSDNSNLKILKRTI